MEFNWGTELQSNVAWCENLYVIYANGHETNPRMPIVGNHEFYSGAELGRYLDSTWEGWGRLQLYSPLPFVRANLYALSPQAYKMQRSTHVSIISFQEIYPEALLPERWARPRHHLGRFLPVQIMPALAAMYSYTKLHAYFATAPRTCILQIATKYLGDGLP